MDTKRKNEAGPIPYRTGRFFCVDSNWFFSTREGLEHGPFATREKAQRECQIYINICLQVENRLDKGDQYKYPFSSHV